ncbi:putative thiol-disulfide oxidoreductase DCC [Wolffia australiana]
MACKTVCSGALRRLPLSISSVSARQCYSVTPNIFGSLGASRRGCFRLQIHGMSTQSKSVPDLKPVKNEVPAEEWKIKMLFDGECPLCMREVDMLRDRNKRYASIKFVDISSEDYSPEDNMGLDYKTVMGRIHAIQADGTVVTDVEAFRRLYEEVGLGWVYAVTKYEPISTIANAVYGVWAKYRLQITGRPPLEDVLLSKKGGKGQQCADNGEDGCKL